MYRGNLPKEIETLFQQLKVRIVHSLTLGKGDSYFMYYQARDGLDYFGERL